MRSKKLTDMIFIMIIFGAIFIFFSKIHPLIIYDMDDWEFASHGRKFFPKAGLWNPARVFPEAFQPICTYFASSVIMLFTNDFINATIISYALFLSIVISAYAYTFYCLLQGKYKVSTYGAILLTAVFVLIHFTIFRSRYSDNVHLFYSRNVTCYFFYIIPNLLNSITVMILFNKDIDSWRSLRNTKYAGLLLLLIYFSIFSNLFPSGILVAYAGAKILYNLFCKKRVKGSSLLISICVAWLISALFELSGRRAGSLQTEESIISQIPKTFENMLSRLKSVNLTVSIVFISAFVIVLSLILYFIKTNNKIKLQKTIKTVAGIFACFLISFVYTLLLCSAVRPYYASFPQASFGLYFFLLCFLFYSIIAVVHSFPQGIHIMPFLFFLLLFETNTQVKTFAEPNLSSLSSNECKAITNYIIDYVKKDEYSHLRIPVPKYNTSNNWPLSLNGGNVVSDALYGNGIIDRPVKIEFYIDETLNQQFHLK